MTILDRYFLRCYLHVFMISFIAMMGLYIVIDAFNNVDNFFNNQDAQGVNMLWEMARFYAFRSCLFFDTIGNVVSITAAMVVLALLQRHGELNPILSAGVPTIRLILPLLWAMVMVDSMIVANKELIIPRIADELHLNPGDTGNEAKRVARVIDHATRIEIGGEHLVRVEKKMVNAQIVLPVPECVSEPTGIEAAEAYYLKDGPNNAGSGWLLKNASPPYDELSLTHRGREIVSQTAEPGDLFLATEISFDRLHDPHRGFRFLSTPELIRRIKSPAYGDRSVRNQSLHLHTRFTRPVMDLVLLFLCFPLMIRREASGLVGSMVLTASVMGLVFGIGQVFLYLGKSNLISTDLAAWGPVIIAGAMSAWFLPLMRT